MGTAALILFFYVNYAQMIFAHKYKLIPAGAENGQKRQNPLETNISQF